MFRKLLLFFVLFVLLVQAAHGQSFNSGKNRKVYKGIGSRYPYHGIGFKLGDPIAITYKFYGSEKFSFALDFGSVSSSLYDRYFRREFPNYVPYDTFTTADASVSYVSHKASSDLVGEAKCLYHFDASDISEGFQIYLGAGWQWKNTNITYNYRYNRGMMEPVYGKFSRKRLTMGPQVILGLEYGSANVPLSAFIEIEYYRDVQVDPGSYRFEGGVGLRYLF